MRPAPNRPDSNRVIAFWCVTTTYKVDVSPVIFGKSVKQELQRHFYSVDLSADIVVDRSSAFLASSLPETIDSKFLFPQHLIFDLRVNGTPIGIVQRGNH